MTLTQNGDSFEGKLQRFEQDGLELIINTETGEVFASQGMIAKLCKQESSTIRYFINKRGVNELPQTLSVIDSRGVEQLSKLHSEDAIYAAIEKYNPALLKQCAKAGLRMYLHGLAGFRYRPIAVEEDFQLKKEEPLTIGLINEAIDAIFGGVNIKPELVAGVKANAIAKEFPQLEGTIAESRQILRANTATTPRIFTPTQLGEEMGGLSAQKVNKLLVEHGLQTKNENRTSRKMPAYEPTARGEEFSTITLSTGKNGDSTSYQQLLWYESVLNLIS